MKNYIILIKFVLIFLFSVRAFAISAGHDETFYMGTGAITGVYYSFGREACNIFNENTKNGYRCVVAPNDGPMDNVEKILSGEYKFAIIDNKTLYDVYHNKSLNPEYKKLRVVLNLFKETFVLAVRKHSNIKFIEDIRGKKVNIGKEKSGSRKLMEILSKIYGIKKEEFSELHQNSIFTQGESLCDEKIDVALYIIGHPSITLHETAAQCQIRFLPIQGAKVEKYLKDNKILSVMEIPPIYDGNTDAVNTVGTYSSLVTSADVPSELVNDLVSTVLENYKQFQEYYPAYIDLTPETMKDISKLLPVYAGK